MELHARSHSSEGVRIENRAVTLVLVEKLVERETCNLPLALDVTEDHPTAFMNKRTMPLGRKLEVLELIEVFLDVDVDPVLLREILGGDGIQGLEGGD
jgi:hypothetical protein